MGFSPHPFENCELVPIRANDALALEILHPCARVAPTLDSKSDWGRAAASLPSPKKLMRAREPDCCDSSHVARYLIKSTDSFLFDVAAPDEIPSVVSPNELVWHGQSFARFPWVGFLGDALK